MNLRRLRINAGKTQAQMANYLGVTQATYSNWELGRHEVDNNSLKKLAEYFNVSIDYILEHIHEQPAFAKNTIKDLRLKHGLSQQELALRIGVHQTAVSQWETGKTNPDIHQTIQLANLFGVSVDHLLGRDDAALDACDTAFGRVIKKLRESSGMSVRELGGVVGESPQVVDAWERGAAKPSVDELLKLAEYFHVSSDYLLGATDDPTPPSKRKYDLPYNPSIRMIARAGARGKLTDDQAEHLRKYAQYMFPEAFDEN